MLFGKCINKFLQIQKASVSDVRKLLLAKTCCGRLTADLYGIYTVRVPYWGVSWSANLMVSFKRDRTDPVAMVMKIE